MKICKIKECESKCYVRGWCIMHYQRWLRHGDPNIVLREIHGYKNHPLYNVWQNMKQRCHNKNCRDYKYYGKRGIIVCSEWKDDVKAFIEWCLSNSWKKELEIDRRNNDRDYTPDNCRFVTHAENTLNTRLLKSTNTSGYRGVNYDKRTKKWITQIIINGEKKHLGSFDSPKLAALRWDVEAYLTDNRPRNFIENI